ncbi:CRISPR/Cas system CSM-associated protein Csm3 (group 7 of RAMP superfamily) [Anaerobacterium chartisolvens]|uniref:CRISPR/Cas system CSM-associated protein Csm3 (Group 7 of RAMP superfamily) n=1 Tax=Anaerobacterium chartisolvens TaxID=1297424 RepID=A0A369AYU4_9FIRM|nr:RAMP superfamily CRISPR-associated protein [Anaerobacterium chartisolvens]RCX13508.1 CRISPR/Cas system CSM-associated protein Csm3 (group 7 of RAMP superfamily) [Anaerobacterium chartisolvens]
MSQFYDFVEFLGPRSFNESGSLNGRIRLEITTQTPIFIGSGYEEIEEGELWKCFQRYGGSPVIPGSTLKGVMRTISQCVSYSCASVDRKRDLPFSTGMCNCIVCKTYGKMGLKGCVSFGEFVSQNAETGKVLIPIQMTPDISKREIYYKGDKLRGIKLYRHGDYRLLENAQVPVEAVMEGAVFKGELMFSGLHGRQLELLCYSLGLDGSFIPKIGGNKAGFFGSCEISAGYAYMNHNTFDPCEYAKKYGISDLQIAKNKQKVSEILGYGSRVKEITQ